MYTSVCTPESAPPSGYSEMYLGRVLVYALQKREVSHHPAFHRTLDFV